MDTPRQRFLDYVRRVPGARPVVSPFLPHGPLVTKTLQHLGLPADGDHFENEIRLARELAYEPMFMCGGSGLIFPWEEDESRSDADWVVSVLPTPEGEWVRKVSRQAGLFGDEDGFPVRTEADHHKLVAVCEQIREREDVIRAYFRDCRQRAGEEGVIVIGHPHVTWLGYQIGQQNMIFHALDFPETYAASMEAIFRASLVLFEFAMAEGVDFMSESGYGMEMISPDQFAAQDLPYTRRLADWTHQRGGLLWYHNCGQTRQLIECGYFSELGADVIETLAPPPDGDNHDLAASRRSLDPAICSKGNLDLSLLRVGNPEQIAQTTREMVQAVEGFTHIHSTADTPFAETPVENFLSFLHTAREEADRLA